MVTGLLGERDGGRRVPRRTAGTPVFCANAPDGRADLMLPRKIGTLAGGPPNRPPPSLEP
ncbi:hypothetical protein GCM10023100_72360 [Actinocorallia cavernae]|uniref:Uncharacterized protein n=2 Tax=Actinomycetes TaxID=1760 RepID=A0ABP8T6M0_9ACTN